MVHKQNDNTAEALKSLKTAMAAPGFKNTSGGHIEDGVLVLSLADKATICLELVQTYLAQHQAADAEQLMKNTLAEFKGKCFVLKIYFKTEI